MAIQNETAAPVVADVAGTEVAAAPIVMQADALPAKGARKAAETLTLTVIGQYRKTPEYYVISIGGKTQYLPQNKFKMSTREVDGGLEVTGPRSGFESRGLIK